MTISEAEDRSVIHIDAVGVQPGDYELKLESYDSESSVQATLKTDTITITVQLGFEFILTSQTISAIEAFSWSILSSTDTVDF